MILWRVTLKPPSSAATLPQNRAEDGAQSDFVIALHREVPRLVSMSLFVI